MTSMHESSVPFADFLAWLVRKGLAGDPFYAR
jgi:hypothetical protein